MPVRAIKIVPGPFGSDYLMEGEGNALYAKTNTFFQECCVEAGVNATKRQASKFRNQRGAAYAVKNQVKQAKNK